MPDSECWGKEEERQWGEGRKSEGMDHHLGGDSTHRCGEKNSLLRYQSHWFLTCLVYALSGIKGGTTGVHIEIHPYSQNLL